MEAACYFETSFPVQQIAFHHILDDSNPPIHRLENLDVYVFLNCIHQNLKLFHTVHIVHNK
jgi:uncharacterized membrane protein